MRSYTHVAVLIQTGVKGNSFVVTGEKSRMVAGIVKLCFVIG